MSFNNPPLVSIITPSYNQGEFIEETIKSVLAQDYQNIEYVIIDGRSTDNTNQILKKYSDKIKWISEKDDGQADAINKGIEMTKGEIIYWLNSDDIILPGVINKVVAYFLKNPSIELVYGKSYFVDVDCNIIGNFPAQLFDYKRLAIIDFIPQPSAFFTKNAYLSVGGLNTKMHYAMDYDFWIRLAKTGQIAFIPEYLSYYRLHNDSKTVDRNQALLSITETIDTVYRYYNWVPATRMYAYCYFLLEPKLNRITKHRALKVVCSLSLAVFKYLKVNKNIRVEDIKYIFDIDNLKKIFVRWENIYKLY